MSTRLLYITLFSLTFLNLSCQNKNIKIHDRWENGNPKIIIEYINTKDTTDYNIIGFFQNSDTNFYYSIRNNERNGISKYYYENGQLKYKVKYKDNQFHGECLFWYPNGNIWQIANYNNGLVNDTLKDFYEEGNLKSLGVFTNGKGKINYFHPNGTLWKSGELINGKEEGKWTCYYSNGALLSEGIYKNGQANGYYKRYYKTGELMESGNYIMNLINEVTFYHKNGDIDHELNTFYKNNKNFIPWTEEQRNSSISKCISDKFKLNESRADDYCKCFYEKIELFLSYSEYLTATDEELKFLNNLIERLCLFE